MTAIDNISVGDLVDAQYVLNTYGTTADLHGIVTNIGDWEGVATVSVTGVEDAQLSHLSSSTGPVVLVASRHALAARETMREILAASRPVRREKLERIAIEEMGMSI